MPWLARWQQPRTNNKLAIVRRKCICTEDEKAQPKWRHKSKWPGKRSVDILLFYCYSILFYSSISRKIPIFLTMSSYIALSRVQKTSLRKDYRFLQVNWILETAVFYLAWPGRWMVDRWIRRPFDSEHPKSSAGVGCEALSVRNEMARKCPPPPPSSQTVKKDRVSVNPHLNGGGAIDAALSRMFAIAQQR